MLAVNTCPSPRKLTASMKPLTTVRAARVTTSGGADARVLAHVRSTFPARHWRRCMARQGNGATSRSRVPTVHRHEGAHAADAGPPGDDAEPRRGLPFIAEAGLGRRGVVIGDDLLGGSFVFDPFELYAAGVVSNPNMVVFGQIGRGKSAFVKTFLWRQAVFGRRAWVVDPRVSTATWPTHGASAPWRCGRVGPSGSIRLDPGPDVEGDAESGRQRAPPDGAALLAGQRLPRPEPGAPRAGRARRGAGRGHPGDRRAHGARGRRGAADADRRRGPFAAYRATRPARGRARRRAGAAPAGPR